MYFDSKQSDKVAQIKHLPWAIEVERVSKCYRLYKSPKDRLKEFFMPRVHKYFPVFGRGTYAQTFWSLSDVSLQLGRGEVLGLIGVNGAGKSSLLQLICGVLQPTSGVVKVEGRIAALLELGAGFNPEFTGRENIVLNATLLGLSAQEIRDKTPGIIDFSGIESFIDQPVKTYSSGMYVRLAFSIATSVDPDILVIDEALSVGDGAFARKSFDRIMALKARGVTILFCSHSIYQVEALCQKALWLHEGKVKAFGSARDVTQAYSLFLDRQSEVGSVHYSNDQALGHTEANFQCSMQSQSSDSPENLIHSSGEPWAKAQFNDSSYEAKTHPQTTSLNVNEHTARLKQIRVLVDGQESKPWVLASERSSLEVQVDFAAGMSLPTPNIGLVISDASGKNITSCSNFYDGVALKRDDRGYGVTTVRFPRIPLLRGRFLIHVFLLCENAILIYDSAMVGEFEVTQKGLELGFVSLQREWIH